MYLVMDFETRSTVDLEEESYRRYAMHSTTDIMCIGLKWKDRPSTTFEPITGAVLDGKAKPTALMEAIRIGCPIVVHGRNFEENIYMYICVKRFGWPEIHPDQWHCTMSSCAYYAVPRGLAKAAKALGLIAQKDIDAGKQFVDEEEEPPVDSKKRKKKPAKPKTRHILKQVSKPRSWSNSAIAKWLADGNSLEDLPVRWWEDIERLQALYKYCRDDCDTQDELYRTLGPLPPARMKEWRLDCKINDRGIPVDWPAIHTMNWLVENAKGGYNDRIKQLTRTPAYPGGMVQSLQQVKKILDWCGLQGVHLASLDKASVIDAMARTDIPEHVREILTIRQNAGKSSLGKLETMLSQTDLDSRVRHSMVWHGAATGRKAGQGIQPHNFPNECLKGDDLDELYNALTTIDPEGALQPLLARTGKSIPSLIVASLRSCIAAPPGYKFIISDLSNIESRNIGLVSGCKLLNEAFAKGECPYKQFAGYIYNIQNAQQAIKKKDKERVLGKVSVLALSYGMGAETFQSTAAGPLYQIDLKLQQADEIKNLFRKIYYEIPEFWKDCEKAFRQAVQEQTTVLVGRVAFGCNGTWGWIVLPSGRPIWYYTPKVVSRPNRFREGKMSSQIVYQGIDSKTHQWRERSTYGGSLAESICQGMAGCILQEICERSEEQGYPIVLTVHDEVVSLVPEHYPADPFHAIVKHRPMWCQDLVIECETHESKRYGK